MKFQPGSEDAILEEFAIELDFSGIGKNFEVKDVLEFRPER